MNPTTTCGICGKTSEELNRIEAKAGVYKAACEPCAETLRLRKAWLAVCDGRIEYAEATPAKCDPLKLQSAAAFYEGQRQKRTLILSGAPGRGKTCLAFVLLRQYLEDGEDCFYLNAVRYKKATELQFSGSEAAKEKAQHMIDRCLEAEVLLLDDLGGKAKMSERLEMELYDLFETRRSKRLITIVTTNCTGADLQKWFSESGVEPLFLRIVASADVITFEPAA